MSDIDYAREYDNSGRVANAAELIDAYVADAAAFRERDDLDAELDLAYGPAERNRMDLFWPDDDAGRARTSPLVMFIHGGYWQRLDRTAFSHMAAGLLARGMAVAVPSYTLAPDISVDGIINELRRACLVLHQTYKRPITVTGHSAGGHLAACMLATDWPKIHPDLPTDLVQSALGISGLYDLLPLLHTPINDALGMDESAAKASSPIEWMPPALHRFHAWVGSEESDEYHRQSRDLARRWAMLGTSCAVKLVPNTNHFTIIAALTQPNSDLVNKIVDLVTDPLVRIDPPALPEDEPTHRDSSNKGEQHEAAAPEEADSAVDITNS